MDSLACGFAFFPCGRGSESGIVPVIRTAEIQGGVAIYAAIKPLRRQPRFMATAKRCISDA
jgi:hypothetical protein